MHNRTRSTEFFGNIAPTGIIFNYRLGAIVGGKMFDSNI
jgi:hypothetical protein